jgi:hypothetical protein
VGSRADGERSVVYQQGRAAMIYKATITCASLRVRESRIIADLLLKEVDQAQWKEAIVENNVLQMKSVESIKRISGLLRSRLKPMGPELWCMVRDGEKELATQATFAAAVKNSRLLGDFLDLTVREQKNLFAPQLQSNLWAEYLAGCRGRDPDMPHWSESTVNRLRSAIYSMLAEVGYIDNALKRTLQNVFIDEQLSQYLKQNGETYVLRCMEVH